MNSYKILGVTDQATDDEVKRAYHRMATKYHPDAGGDAWVFAQVREAYDQILRSRQASSSSAANVQRPASAATQAQPARPHSAEAYSTGSRATSSASQAAKASTERQSIGKRIYNLLFYHQLPLQSETNYFILVNVLDIVFTNILLRMHAIEANPIANYVLIHFGFPGMITFKLLLVAGVCLITQLIAVQHIRRARQTLYFGTAIVGVAVVYSAFLLIVRS